MKIHLQKAITSTLVFMFIIFIYSYPVMAVETTSTLGGDFNTYDASDFSANSSNSSSSCGSIKNITDFFTYALCVLDSGIIPFLISIGLIIFIAGVVKFVGAGDNEEKRQGGRDMMIFGIIALFVMVSVWGFVNILSNSIFGKNSEIQSLPKKSTSLYAPQ